MIEGAKSSIDFAIYGLRGQPEVLEALQRAEKRGVQVRGVVDKDLEGKSYYSDTPLLEKKLSNVRSDHAYDQETARILSGRRNSGNSRDCSRPFGAEGPLQCFEGKGYASEEEIQFVGDIMHNKFFIVDKRFVWTGSANISDTGIGGYNANLVALIDSPEVAAFYATEFNQMFEGGEFHRRKSKLKKADLQAILPEGIVRLYFSPQGYAVRRGVLPLIEQANESIDIAMFFLTHKAISKALVEAHERGVDIRVILDATGATNGYSKHGYLRENGISVKVENWGGKMHMKAAIFDGKHLALGSMNWTAAGEKNNDENLIVVRDASKTARAVTVFYDSLWVAIPDRWLNEDPSPESPASGTACTDSLDNDFDNLVDSGDPGCAR
jgi:phosphatidylserine/phosphatidylglycerophosphate/cardiolipin synthase-like enzyme